LAAAAGQVEQARVQVQHAQEAYDKVKDMPNVGMFPQSIQLQQATITYETAQAQHCVSARGANQAQLAGAQAQIAQAQATIDKLQRGPSASQLEIAQAGVDQAQLAVEQAQRRLENARIEAPSDGVVTAVNIVAGSLAQPGTPAIQISDISRFHIDVIDVLVDEADIASIAVSQPVTLELDALTNQKLAGHVSMISPAATPGTGGVVSYEVTVTIDPTDAPLRAGMSATAIITSSSHENVLLVPNRSVQIARDSGKSYVERLTNGVPQRIEVRLGLRDDTQSEVREGLVDGERGSSATSAASSNLNRPLVAPRNSATSHDRRK
jgi:HlyD family secretion protein